MQISRRRGWHQAHPDFGSEPKDAVVAPPLGRHDARDTDVVNRGNLPEWDRGPILEAVNYPEVLVARAVTDGDALHLVLRPGTPKSTIISA